MAHGARAAALPATVSTPPIATATARSPTAQGAGVAAAVAAAAPFGLALGGSGTVAAPKKVAGTRATRGAAPVPAEGESANEAHDADAAGGAAPESEGGPDEVWHLVEGGRVRPLPVAAATVAVSATDVRAGRPPTAALPAAAGVAAAVATAPVAPSEVARRKGTPPDESLTAAALTRAPRVRGGKRGKEELPSTGRIPRQADVQVQAREPAHSDGRKVKVIQPMVATKERGAVAGPVGREAAGKPPGAAVSTACSEDASAGPKRAWMIWPSVVSSTALDEVGAASGCGTEAPKTVGDEAPGAAALSPDKPPLPSEPPPPPPPAPPLSAAPVEAVPQPCEGLDAGPVAEIRVSLPDLFASAEEPLGTFELQDATGYEQVNEACFEQVETGYDEESELSGVLQEGYDQWSGFNRFELGWTTGGTGGTDEAFAWSSESMMQSLAQRGGFGGLVGAAADGGAAAGDRGACLGDSGFPGGLDDYRFGPQPPQATHPIVFKLGDVPFTALCNGAAKVGAQHHDVDMLSSLEAMVDDLTGVSSHSLMEDALVKVDAAREALSKAIKWDSDLRLSAPSFVPGQLWTGSQQSAFVD